VKNNHSINSVKTSFSAGKLTNYSGLYPLFKFMQKIKLLHPFMQNLSILHNANQLYSAAQILQTIVWDNLAGMNRLIKMGLLGSTLQNMRVWAQQVAPIPSDFEAQNPAVPLS
jgi:hypothetical protein